MHEPVTVERRASPGVRRSSILVRLLDAFLVVSFIPIAVLAILLLQEAAADPEVHVEGTEAAETAAATEAIGHGRLFGIPIEFVELGVAGVSLLLSIGAAVYVGRTIVRPIRSLEAAMHRVETASG